MFANKLYFEKMVQYNTSIITHNQNYTVVLKL